MSYLQGKPLGPNVKRLLVLKVAKDAIPDGGGFAAGIDALMTPGRMVELSRNALMWIEEALTVFKSASDNPYGDNDEAIAGAILHTMGEEGN